MLKEISVEIIRKCTNNCMHCSSNSNIERREIMPYDKFVEIVDDAKTLGAKTICLSGGEPFLHKDIDKMIKYVSENGLDCYVYTSGIVLDNEMRKSEIPERLLSEIQPYLTKIIFNIEAANEYTYDRIMGTKNCFDLLKKSVISVNKFKITSEAHFVPMKLNIKEVEDVVELCKELKINKISFLRLVVHGRAETNRNTLELSDDDYLPLKDKLLDLQRKNESISIRIGVPLLNKSNCVKCEAAEGKLNIRYDGNVYPCEVFKNKNFSNILGNHNPSNIYEKTLKEIYDNSDYLNYVRKLSKEFQKTATCEMCVGQYFLRLENEGE